MDSSYSFIGAVDKKLTLHKVNSQKLKDRTELRKSLFYKEKK